MTEIETRELEVSIAPLLERAGASEIFTDYVISYPDSTVSMTVQYWVQEGLLADDNAEAGKPYSGGYFFDALWSGDREEALRNADVANRKNMEAM